MASGLSGHQGDMVGKSLLALDHMISLPKHVKNLKQKACKYVEKILQIVVVLFQICTRRAGMPLNHAISK